MVESHEAYQKHNYGYNKAVCPHSNIVITIPKEREPEHFDDWSNWIELEQQFPLYGYTRYGIDYWRGIHEKGKAKADKIAKITVLRRERGDHDA